ncbi:MAG: ATP synthase F1 subunit epsilon [Candidatus Azobacteroides sp.]|nr:ATP synthase F1 subunit epsilon [Candidatus Azobacteroides sp.]
MNLEIVSPEKIIYSGQAESVTLPGLNGLFTILDRHAPIISALKKGVVSYSIKGKNEEVITNGGFVEAKKNNVSVCIE